MSKEFLEPAMPKLPNTLSKGFLEVLEFTFYA